MADLSNNNDEGAKTPTGQDDIRKAVEGALTSDESDDDDPDDDGDDDDSEDDSSGDNAGGDGSKDDSDDDDADEEDDEKKTETGDKKDPKSDRKYSQFKGDGSDTAYISNLEEGYKNSSAEAIRLKGELDTVSGRMDTFLRVVASSPELSKAFNGALEKGGAKGGSDDSSSSGTDDGKNRSPLDNPFLQSVQTEWQEKSKKEIQEILDANPEIITDPELAAKVKHYMGLFSEDYLETNKKLMSGGEAMLAAMKHLGIEDKRQKQDLASGAKKNLTPPRSRGNKAKKSEGQKSEFTADQLAMAKAMGHDEAWLQKNAR